MGAFAQLVYLTLALTEGAALVKLALRGPALQKYEHLLKTDACFAEPGMKSYPFLGSYLDHTLCGINLLFNRGANGSKASAMLLTTFGPLFMTACAIATYESFKPVHLRRKGIVGALARATSWMLMLGQRITAGFVLPFQRVFTNISTSSIGKPANSIEYLRETVPAAKYIWTTYVSIVLGLAIPTLYMQIKKFDYDPLSIWQPFPLYMLALNVILPPLFSWAKSRSLPTILLTAVLIFGSVRSNLALVQALANGQVTLREIALLDPPADTLTVTYGAHVVFAIDMAWVFTTNVIAVLFGNGAGLGGFLLSAIPYAAATVLLGPGGSTALFWCAKELKRQRALTKASPTNGKLKTY